MWTPAAAANPLHLTPQPTTEVKVLACADILETNSCCTFFTLCTVTPSLERKIIIIIIRKGKTSYDAIWAEDEKKKHCTKLPSTVVVNCCRRGQELVRWKSLCLLVTMAVPWIVWVPHTRVSVGINIRPLEQVHSPEDTIAFRDRSQVHPSHRPIRRLLLDKNLRIIPCAADFGRRPWGQSQSGISSFLHSLTLCTINSTSSSST